MLEENKKHDSESYKISSDCLLKSKHEPNSIKNVIGVVSGKGGVGKSLITSMTAVMLRRKGYQVGVMDADITGPSIPKIFGAEDLKPDNREKGLFPIRTQSDIKLMSINLLLNRKDDPVIWRGPLIAKTVKHFWTDVVWGNLDYLLIDMPPGTGDVPLTIFQSIPLNGIIIVTSPQDLVSLIVRKAYRMAKVMNIPVLGFVENMSYAVCPKCGDHIDIFGKSKATRVAREMGIPLLGQVPVDPELAAICDKGEIEMMRKNYLCEVEELLGNLHAGGKNHE
ncbi:MAG TPA: Mrp/NBP35 family ATP-binding protein [Bacilli bacterium]|nr:Mrp/NBP35 family ATP-binding protein [Bacilli bacterium]